MILLIGNAHRRGVRGGDGFSLIEVILCVVLLSTGLIAVNQTLLRSLSAIGYIENRFEANRLTENKIWEIQNQVWYQNKPPDSNEAGVLLGGRKTFSYTMQSAPSGGSLLLYEVRLKVEWPESGRDKGLSRAFYASLKELPQT